MSYECYECRACQEPYENPVKCPNCKEDLCRKHIDSENRCPFCDYFPFFKEKPNPDSIYKCILCNGNEKDKNSFWVHLMEKHKEEIISKFRGKDEPTPTDTPTKNIDNNKIYKSQKSLNFNYSNNNNFDNKYNYNNINEYDPNDYGEDRNIESSDNRSINYNNKNNKSSQNLQTYRNYKPKDNIKPKKEENDSFRELKYMDESNEIVYCNKKNELIKCECCPDHICKEGNCLCVKCMRKNVFNFRLVNGELINRAGKIAKLFKGEYYCGSPYVRNFEDYSHRQYKNPTICEYPSESCDDCKVLTKFKDIYYGM